MSEECGVCAVHNEVESGGDAASLVAWESPRWLLRHHGGRAPLVGWFLLDTRRHVQGPAGLDELEQRELGVVLSACSRAISAATGAPRVYAVFFGEGARHLHAHLIPHQENEPGTAAWSVADWYRAVESVARPAASMVEVARAVAAVRAGMSGFTP